MYRSEFLFCVLRNQEIVVRVLNSRLAIILKNIVPVMHCCSEAEAESLGIFFSELFALLNHWSKRVNWTKECASNLAFCRKF